jgi:uncharacterized damage-inducible protein DinB
MTPEQANFLLHEVYLPALKNEHRTTKSVIEAVPGDKGDYRPDPFARTALELAWHIAAAENRFLQTTINGAFDATPRPRPESIRNAAEVARWYAETFEKNVQRLPRLTGEELVRMIDFRGLFERPAVLFLELALQHSVHHRGQLSVYLRPMGSKVPAIYGESYDSAQARQAAAQR